MAKDFVPILEIGNGTIAVLVTPSLPVKNVQELIALAKSKPGQLSYASSGFGGLIHLNYEMLRQMTGAEMTCPTKAPPSSRRTFTRIASKSRSTTCWPICRTSRPARCVARRHRQDALAAFARRADHGGGGRAGAERRPTTRCSRPSSVRPTSSRS